MGQAAFVLHSMACCQGWLLAARIGHLSRTPPSRPAPADGSIKGGNARCLALVAALTRVVADYKTPEGKSLSRDLTTTINGCVDFLVRRGQPRGSCSPAQASCVAAWPAGAAPALFAAPSLKCGACMYAPPQPRPSCPRVRMWLGARRCAAAP